MEATLILNFNYKFNLIFINLLINLKSFFLLPLKLECLGLLFYPVLIDQISQNQTELDTNYNLKLS